MNETVLLIVVTLLWLISMRINRSAESLIAAQKSYIATLEASVTTLRELSEAQRELLNALCPKDQTSQAPTSEPIPEAHGVHRGNPAP